MEGQRLGLVFGVLFLAGCASIVYLMNYSLYPGNLFFSPMGRLEFVGSNVFPDENDIDFFIVLQIKNTGDVDLIINNELETMTNIDANNVILDSPPKYVFQDRTLNVGETTMLFISMPKYDNWKQTKVPGEYWYGKQIQARFRVTAYSESARNSPYCQTWVTIPY